MTDVFTRTVAKEVASLLLKQGEVINRSNLSSGSTTNEGFQLTPEQVLQVMQGNRQWVTEFEQQMDASFRRIADNALDYWLQNTDREIRRSLQAASDLGNALEARSRDRDGFDFLPENTGQAPKSPIDGLFKRTLDQGAKSLFDGLFNRTRTSSSETARSSETTTRYRASRGQSQAQLSRELSRGNRYT